MNDLFLSLLDARALKGLGLRGKELLLWNGSIQDKVRNKRECFKALHGSNIAENWARYRNARNEARNTVSET